MSVSPLRDAVHYSVRVSVACAFRVCVSTEESIVPKTISSLFVVSVRLASGAGHCGLGGDGDGDGGGKHELTERGPQSQRCYCSGL